MDKQLSNAKAAKDLDKIIGNKVNELRLNKGLTRQELAKQIGVTHQQLQKYVKGTNRITASRLVDIAEALDTPIMYFFEDTSNKEVMDKLVLEKECIAIMSEFSKITDTPHREVIHNLIKVFVNDEAKQAA